MSRVGKKPIDVAKNVKVTVNDGVVTVSGPKGALSHKVNDGVGVKFENNRLFVSCESTSRPMKALFGLNRALIANMVNGVANGYRKEILVSGVGFKAEKKGEALVLTVGYTNPVEMEIPKGVEVKIEDKNTRIILESADRHVLGQYAADIRGIKPPEPYKGKGILYGDEKLRRKVGKAGAK